MKRMEHLCYYLIAVVIALIDIDRKASLGQGRITCGSVKVVEPVTYCSGSECLTAETPARAAVNEACLNLSQCPPPNLTKALVNNDVEALCRIITNSRECFEKNLKLCNFEEIKNGFRGSLRAIQHHYDAKCAHHMEPETPAVTSFNQPCEKLKKCLLLNVSRIMNGDDDNKQLCRLKSELMACIEVNTKLCDDEELKTSLEGSFGTAKEEYRKHCADQEAMNTTVDPGTDLACKPGPLRVLILMVAALTAMNSCLFLLQRF